MAFFHLLFLKYQDNADIDRIFRHYRAYLITKTFDDVLPSSLSLRGWEKLEKITHPR